MPQRDKDPGNLNFESAVVCRATEFPGRDHSPSEVKAKCRDTADIDGEPVRFRFLLRKRTQARQRPVCCRGSFSAPEGPSVTQKWPRVRGRRMVNSTEPLLTFFWKPVRS